MSFSAQHGISAGYVPLVSKQGISEARLSMSSGELDQRYATLQGIGIGYRQYNLWWSSLEPSGQPSSIQPMSCPAGTTLIPANATEKQQKGYQRYRCVNVAHLAVFDELLRRDAAAGFQSGVVLWSSPEIYRYSGCQGFHFGGIQLKEGCVPRDDAMDDFEDYLNLVADRYRGGNNGKIHHFIIWNEVASDGWFDYSPVAPKGSTATPDVHRRIDKYTEMMQRAHRAVARHSNGVMIYAATDMLWAADLHQGHYGSKLLLEGLWQRLGTSLPWGVAVHPYGDPETPPADETLYTFANLEIVTQFQQQQLAARGIDDPASYPQAYLIASEQGWPRSLGQTAQARAICAAHAKATGMWNLIAVAHNYFHSVEPQESQDGSSNQEAFYGLLPYEVRNDLSNMMAYETGQAYASTNPAFWQLRADHYCCSQHRLGCPKAADPANHPVIGHVDGVTVREGETVVFGWACARGIATSIAVHVYLGGPAGGGTIDGASTANLSSEGAVAAACGTSHTAYRFEHLLSANARQQFAGQKVFVHGISPVGGEHALLGNAGQHTVPGLATSSATAPVYRFYSALASDHLLTTSSSVDPALGYVYEGIAFEVFTAGGANRTMLYRCYAKASQNHFVSPDVGCEGQLAEGAYGWVASSAEAGAGRPIYRCFSTAASNHLTTSNRAECDAAGYTVEGIQGYVR